MPLRFRTAPFITAVWSRRHRGAPKSKPHALMAGVNLVGHRDRGRQRRIYRLHAIYLIASTAYLSSAGTLKGSKMRVIVPRRRLYRCHFGLLPPTTRPRRDRDRPPGHAWRRNQLRQRRANFSQPRRALGQPGAPLKVLQWLGRKTPPVVSRARRPAPVALGPAVPAQLHPGAHATISSRSCAWAPTAVRPAAAAPRHRHRVRPAHPGHPAFLYQPEGI